MAPVTVVDCGARGLPMRDTPRYARAFCGGTIFLARASKRILIG